jgi:hypothetical protein
MAIHKLMIDDFDEADYMLIAIHSSLEDYRLAYFVNRELELRLEKCPKDIGFKHKQTTAFFSRFIFEDTANDIAWNLIQNKNSVNSTLMGSASLFTQAGLSVTTSSYFIPELKTVDFILKVDNIDEYQSTETIVTSLLDVKHIATAYTIDHYKLKSKNNLIF